MFFRTGEARWPHTKKQPSLYTQRLLAQICHLRCKIFSFCVIRHIVKQKKTAGGWLLQGDCNHERKTHAMQMKGRCIRIQYKCLVPISVFPEIELCRLSLYPKQNYNALSPNFHIHVSVGDLYISRICLHSLLPTDPGIYNQLSDTCKDSIQKLGTRPRSFISGNTSIRFLVQCGLINMQIQKHLSAST